jgi:hypothetical protein
VAFSQYLALQIGQSGDCGADANLVDTGVGRLFVGAYQVLSQLGFLGPGTPGPVCVDNQPPGDRHQSGSA